MKYKECESCHYSDDYLEDIYSRVCNDCSGNDTTIKSRYTWNWYCADCKNAYKTDMCISCVSTVDGNSSNFEKWNDK
jgi:hypothetical protein